MILVLGSGVSGLSCVLAAAEAGTPVTLVTPGSLSAAEGLAAVLAGGNTAMAQGGIAAAVGPGDSTASHAADTVSAGVGLVDAEAAAVLTAAGADAVRALLADGFSADRAIDGTLALGLEAAHSASRIVHAGEDRTGVALHAFLTNRVLELARTGRIELVEHAAAVSLLCDAGEVTGAVLENAEGQLSAVRAAAVVLATGGYSGLFDRTSGNPGARGEGIVLGARAGALVADLEFVQFHPTALIDTGFLVSEAVRGAGAVLRDGAGERFMRRVHPDAELAPRDVVARELHRTMRDRQERNVWLDATGIEREGGPGTLARRFPSITAAALAQGFDWAREPIPVAPAAHYTMGGIVTDLHGRSTVPGLFAVGEVASTGVHGANRLASNSLLEGLAFGRRAAHAAVGYAAGARSGASWEVEGHGSAELVARSREFPSDAGLAANRHPGTSSSALHAISAADAQPIVPEALPYDAVVRGAVEAGLGIERDAHGLREVAAACAGIPGPLAELARMVAAAAEARTESRGAHQRSDHGATDPGQARRVAWSLPRSARSSVLSDTDTASNTVPASGLLRESVASC